MIRLLALFLCALPLFAEGGIQGVPPWPNQRGAELLTNGDLESMTGWNLGTGASASAGTGVGGSQSVVFTANDTTDALSRDFTSPDFEVYPWLEVSFYLKRETGSDREVFVYLKDGTDSNAFAPATVSYMPLLSNTVGENVSEVVQDNADYLEVIYIFAPSQLHSSENWQLELNTQDGTTGSLWVDNISVKGANYPLYNFVKYPNNKGYLWSGYDSHLCAGATVDEACGFVDVRPPTGTTIAQTYVEVHHDTTAGCASPTATVTVQPTVQRTTWEMDLSAVADDATVYICAQLRLDSGGTLISTFPDWKIIKRTTAWRTTNLEHWVDDYGRWVDGTTPKFMWMTYQRWAGNCCVYDGAGAVDSYLALSGFQRRTIWEDFTRSARNVTLYFSPFSGANTSVSNDQFTPWFDALEILGLRYFNVFNQFTGELFGADETEDGDEAPSAPTVTCSSTGGSISNAWVYVKVAGVAGRNTLEQFRFLLESEASASDHNDTVLSGSTNSCTVTPPACTESAIGWWIYADGAASESEPANGSYALQTTRFVPCGGTYALTTIIDSQKEPLTASLGSTMGQMPNPITSRPTWMAGGETPLTVASEISTLAAGRSELIGYYIGDEITGFDSGHTYWLNDWMRVNDPGRLNMAVIMQVRANAGTDWFYSPILDINAQDIYYEGQSTAEDEQSLGALGASGRAVTCYAYTPGNNVTASYNNGNLNKVDEWSDLKMRSHEGSRMNLPVVQQWTRTSTTCNGWTLAEMRKQLWKAIIGTQNWGSIGGVGTWGWVSADGLPRMADQPTDQVISGGDSRGHTEALQADIKAGAEMMAIEHVLLEPVDDSTKLGFGTILDTAPTSSISLPTTNCTLKDSPIPIRTVAKQMDNGDQWIFATNLCPDSQTMTFSLANATGKIATDYLTGATYTITGGDFTVSSTDFDVHVIKVETPKGGGIRGR